MKEILAINFRLLTFRLTAEEFEAFDQRYTYWGLAMTILVGIGRWWDSEDIHWFFKTGLTSVIVVYFLALFLTPSIYGLAPHRYAFRHFFTFLLLTAPPAAIYAIPVEMFLLPVQANFVNAGFLFLVATWRLALLFFYCTRHLRMLGKEALVGIGLPLDFVILVLSAFSALMIGISRGMGGFREPDSFEKVMDVIVPFIFWTSLVSFLPLAVLFWRFFWPKNPKGEAPRQPS